MHTYDLGFTGGNNAITRLALESEDPPEYVLLLNADTIVWPNAFEARVDFMDQNSKVGIAGSRLEDPDGTRSGLRSGSNRPWGEFEGNLKLGPVSRLLSRWVVAPPVVNEPFETDWVSGASMTARRRPARRGLLHLFRRHRLLLECKKEGLFGLYLKQIEADGP
ncbi:hypothetical protein [Bradyrhizobium ottawaense]|uniref:hypothetical protein n=1 Tax=Bradyrhizobium ottawaense TaxID=931866 RepID=UPI00115FCAC5|nr:hypothetical protein [Bradyrhizobium ottawaense]